MPPEVRPVRGSRDLETFIRFPWQIYRGDPNWVPPLLSDMRLMHDPARNPFFEHAQVQNFMAWDGGRPVGRISAIRNSAHNEFHGDTVGFFGFFECERRPEVAQGLLREAALWLGSQGLTSARGPMNFSTNDDCGLLVKGFDRPPVVMMPYNPPWYEELLCGAGLAKSKDLLAYTLSSPQMPERLEQAAARLMQRRRITMRTMNMKEFEREVDRVRDIYNDAWERNWGFVPMTERELQHMAVQLKPAVDPELVIFAEVDGRPVAFALALPDLFQALRHVNGRLFPFGLFQFLWYKRNIHFLRVLTLGIKAGYRNLGIDALMIREIYRRGSARGYTNGEFSWVLEDNLAMRRPIESLGAVPYKTYRVYEAPLERLT